MILQYVHGIYYRKLLILNGKRTIKISTYNIYKRYAIQGNFSLPVFDVSEEANGYSAICSIDECDMSFKGYGKLDSDAINEAAFKMLNHILGYDIK